MSIFKSLFGDKEYKDSNSSSETILLLDGMIKYEAGKISQSVDLFSEGIKIHPQNPFFYYMRGNANEDLKLYEDAIEDFKKFLAIRPNKYNALFRIGLCYQNQKKVFRGITVLQ